MDALEYDHEANEKYNIDDYKELAAMYPIVDDRDKKVADNWVQRHPHMQRLTGVHPFNSEPMRLPELLDFGFISPVNLHIVRDHGAVPKIKWEEHKRAYPCQICSFMMYCSVVCLNEHSTILRRD